MAHISAETFVVEGDAARAILPYNALVKLLDLDDHACFVPFGRVWPGLILDPHGVTDSQWWEDTGVL